MPTKTYILLESMNSTAPMYQQTADKQRVKIDKIPIWSPYLKVTFQDESSINKTIRLKLNSNTVDQKEQIEKEKLEANVPFTTNERRAVEFKFGILVTDRKIVQDYLESYPAMEGFKGICDDVKNPVYKLLDYSKETKIQNTSIRLRVDAMNKVLGMKNLEDLQALMIRLNGSFFTPPDNIEDCENELVNFIDDSGDEGLAQVMKEDKAITVDDKTKILIGRLLAAEKLSFDKVDGVISKKDKNDKWITIRDMSDEYNMEEKMRLFSDFLNTEDGKPLRIDLEKDLKKVKD